MVANEYNYAVGRRKETSAVIKLFPKGKGNFTTRLSSGKELSLKEYFGGNAHLYENAIMPLLILGKEYAKQFDAEIVIRGGGVSGQSDAIKLAFARALVDRNSDFRTQLKPYGLLKRDPRIKERKKPGLKKARKAPTWSKR
ncbi:MAG: 30S ribosomal protein S9 [Candidatus Absconditabacterales bacterium]|nr:30S ribosomal protein S9 [Candidatus Absconditabacterales bacterium]